MNITMKKKNNYCNKLKIISPFFFTKKMVAFDMKSKSKEQKKGWEMFESYIVQKNYST